MRNSAHTFPFSQCRSGDQVRDSFDLCKHHGTETGRAGWAEREYKSGALFFGVELLLCGFYEYWGVTVQELSGLSSPGLLYRQQKGVLSCSLNNALSHEIV